MSDYLNDYLTGCDILGDDTIPSVAANYNNDSATVRAVQTALKAKGYNPGTIDGEWGKNTAAAIKKLQADIGADTNGNIDYGVIAALGVIPGGGGSAAVSKRSSSSSSSSPSSSGGSYASNIIPGVSKPATQATTDPNAFPPWKIGVVAGAGALLLTGVVMMAVRK